MADQTLLAKARKARHPFEDVGRFLKSIKNITKANDESNNKKILEIVRSKLTQSAGIWFGNHESTFHKWSEFEIAFRNRYVSSTMIHKKFDKLKQRKQQHDETVTPYVDDVVNLCQEIDPAMTDMMIIQHLMSRLNPKFQKELSRRESSMNTLKEFLKHAKIEQDLYDTFKKSRNLSLESSQPYFDVNHSSIPSLTASIKQQPQQYYLNMKQDNRLSYPIQLQSSFYKRNSAPERNNYISTTSHKQTHNYSPQLLFKRKSFNNQPTLQHQFTNCKVCGRKNYRSIDCFHKRTTGCYNCGQNHNIRDCNLYHQISLCSML